MVLTNKASLETELRAIDKKLTKLCQEYPWYKLAVLTGQLQILISELRSNPDVADVSTRNIFG